MCERLKYNCSSNNATGGRLIRNKILFYFTRLFMDKTLILVLFHYSN